MAMDACPDDDRLQSPLDPKMSLAMTLITGSAHRPHHLLLLVKEWTMCSRVDAMDVQSILLPLDQSITS